jgi:hypothetical protein
MPVIMENNRFVGTKFKQTLNYICLILCCIELSAVCFANKDYNIEKLKAMQTLQDACLDN